MSDVTLPEVATADASLRRLPSAIEDADRNDGEHDGIFGHRLTSVPLHQEISLIERFVEQLGPPRARGLYRTERGTARVYATRHGDH